MTEATRRRPSAGQFASSILLALAMVCLVVGVVTALGMLGSVGDPTVTFGEWIITVLMAILVYGPMMVATGFPITIPVIAVLGVLVAVGRLRYQQDRKTPAGARAAAIVLFGYAAASTLTWAALLLRARGRG